MNSSSLILEENFALYLNSIEIVFAIVSILFTTTISGASLVFATLKLKLNVMLKSIIISMISANLLGSSIQFCGIVLFLNQHRIPSLLFCRLMSYPPASTVPGSFLMSPLISMLRIYMSKLAAESKVAKIKVLFPLIIVAIVASFSCWPFQVAILEWNESVTLISKCLMQDLKVGSLPLRISGHAFILICMALGALSDYEMYLFVKKRNSGQSEIQLVAWKSQHQECLDQDLHIPIRATLISTCGFVLIFFLTILAYSELFYDSVFAHFHSIDFISFGSFCSSLLPCILMMFNFKKRNKIQNAQPPNELQLHDLDRQAEDHEQDIRQDHGQDFKQDHGQDILQDHGQDFRQDHGQDI